MGVGNYVHRLLGTMIRLCGDELLWKVHKISNCGFKMNGILRVHPNPLTLTRRR